jgi:hypothetical protein
VAEVEAGHLIVQTLDLAMLDATTAAALVRATAVGFERQVQFPD